jgi:hypothetical protein
VLLVTFTLPDDHFSSVTLCVPHGLMNAQAGVVRQSIHGEIRMGGRCAADRFTDVASRGGQPQD